MATSKEVQEQRVQKVPLDQMHHHKVQEVKSTCQKIDLNIKRKEIILKVLATKNTTIKRDKDKREVTKKEDLNLTLTSQEWENLKIKEHQTCLISSRISKICKIWINLKFKSCWLMFCRCMAMILEEE
ncbi:MAG: hypothetical protein ACI8YC_001615 [Salibacteraceae bacterium]